MVIDTKNLVLDVFLKNGATYTQCNLAGSSGRVVSDNELWIQFIGEGNEIVMIPTNEVESVVLYERIK